MAASVIDETTGMPPYDMTSSRMMRVSQCEARPRSGKPISGRPSHDELSRQPKYFCASSYARPLVKNHTSSASEPKSSTGCSVIRFLRSPEASRADRNMTLEKPAGGGGARERTWSGAARRRERGKWGARRGRGGAVAPSAWSSSWMTSARCWSMSSLVVPYMLVASWIHVNTSHVGRPVESDAHAPPVPATPGMVGALVTEKTASDCTPAAVQYESATATPLRMVQSRAHASSGG